MWEMTRLTRIRADRRRVLAGGAALFAGTVAFHKAGAQSATARSPEHAIFTEFSSELKLLKAGWNTRVFTHTDARRGKRDSMRFRYRDHHPGAGLLPLQRRVRGRLHERGKACGDDHGARTGIGGLLPAPDHWSKSRVESRYARRRQRRPQCHLHRQPEHREPQCEPVRSVSGNRQDRRNGAGTSIGQQLRSKSTCESSRRIPHGTQRPESAFGLRDSPGGAQPHLATARPRKSVRPVFALPQ
jgi:hypothetical protein